MRTATLLITILIVFCYRAAAGDSTALRHDFHKAPISQPIDSIVVVKHFRHIYLFSNGQLLKVYRVWLGQAPVGAKHFQGDLKTPEGLYHIDGKNANSVAHKSIGISYPNDSDRAYARRAGKAPGGDIKIHGTMNSDDDGYEDSEDWTWGCIALKNKDVDELFDHVVQGAPILILP